MNPNAAAFEPKKKKSKSSAAAAAAAAQEEVNSKLRPTAEEWQPSSGKSKKEGQSTPPQQDEGEEGDSDTGSPVQLSPNATPYTPTRKHRSPNTAGSGGDFPKPPPGMPPTKGDGASPLQMGTPSGSSTHQDPSSPMSPATPHFFQRSKLPVPAVPKAAPAEPTRFNSTWTLYADDHPVVIGGDMSKFHDPVVVQLVGDLETFWRLWRYLPTPSSRVPSFTYHWFRKDIRPSWEEPRNKNGGTLNVTVFDKDRLGMQSKDAMDDAFLMTVLAVTGESIAEAANINGAVMKIRKTSMIQLWTVSAEKAKLQSTAEWLRKNLLSVLGERALAKIEFYSHSQALQQTQAPKNQRGKYGAKPAAKPGAKEPDFTF